MYPSIAQLRAAGTVIDSGDAVISGLDCRVSGQCKDLLTSTTMAFSLTPESVRELVGAYGHEDDDIAICLRVLALDASNCTSDPDLDDILSIEHEANVGLYGPEPACAHDDWVGTDGVSSPDAAGNFEVDGDGTLYLELPCGYGDRLDDVPNQNFPTGMPGVPDMADFHRADLWRGYNGALGQDGLPYSVPAEGCYCGRGWPCLRFHFDGPEACTLTVVLRNVRHISTNNHLTDASRQTTSTHTTAEESFNYSLTVTPDEYGYIYIAVPDEGTEPDLEQVARVTLSGFADGDWQLSEPYWSLDPLQDADAHNLRVKSFEAVGYRDGGQSGHSDSVSLAALMDTTESNLGHDNAVEIRTVRNFDYRMSAGEAALDLTVAYTLAAQASRLTNVCDAWEASIDEAARDAHLEDEDEAVLSLLWAFGICGPLGAARPLERDVGDGTFVVAIRAGSWTIARGIRYVLWPDLVIGGMGHGVADAGGVLARNEEGFSSLWRRELGTQDDWVHVADLDGDAHGHWHSPNAEVVMAYENDTAVFWEYGVGTNATSVTLLGRFATREYQAAQLLGGGDVWTLFIPEARVLLYFYTVGDEIWLIYSNHERQWWEDPDAGHYPYDVPHKVCAGTCPSAYRDLRHGFIVLGYVLEAQAYVRTSEDMGETWSDAMAVDLGVEVERSMQWQDEDSQLAHIVAVTSVGELIHAKSSDNFVTLLDEYAVVTDGVPTRQPCGYTQRGVGGHGTLLVGFVGADNSQRQFKSENLGEGWEEVE